MLGRECTLPQESLCPFVELISGLIKHINFLKVVAVVNTRRLLRTAFWHTVTRVQSQLCKVLFFYLVVTVVYAL